MTTVADLRAQVAARYDRLGLPSWPDPRPAGASPRDEEYSRVSDPGRYRIAPARARVWADVLAASLGARVEEVAPLPVAPAGDARASVGGLRVTSSAPGTLPLLLLDRPVPADGDEDVPGRGEPMPSVQIAVSRPDLVVGAAPVCGCDACDSGSDEVLESVDRSLAAVVAGPVVLLRNPRWEASWGPDGTSVGRLGRGRMPDVATVGRWSRALAAGEGVRLPRGTRTWVGGSWLVADGHGKGA